MRTLEEIHNEMEILSKDNVLPTPLLLEKINLLIEELQQIQIKEE